MSAIDRKVEPKANEILKIFGIESSPEDVFNIAKKPGIKVYFDSLDSDTSGVMLYKNKITRVTINSAHHVNRQRFTLAHEIGNFPLHLTKNQEERVFVDKKFR